MGWMSIWKLNTFVWVESMRNTTLAEIAHTLYGSVGHN